QKFNGTLNADIQLDPVVITTSPSNGVTFTYDRDEGQFEMYGGGGLVIGKGDTQFRLDATLGDSADPGGVYIPSPRGAPQGEFRDHRDARRQTAGLQGRGRRLPVGQGDGYDAGVVGDPWQLRTRLQGVQNDRRARHHREPRDQGR